MNYNIISQLQDLKILSPSKVLFIGNPLPAEWRVSVGELQLEPVAYELAIYPAFCYTPKAMFHYAQDKASDLIQDLEYLKDSDRVAAAFALSRGKESFELFAEQKLLLDLGLRHYALDNYYQQVIKQHCDEYLDLGTIQGRAFKVSFLKGLYR